MDLDSQIECVRKELIIIKNKEKELLNSMRKLQCLKTNKCSVEDILTMVQLG